MCIRDRVDAAHAEGMLVRHISLRFDIAETNLRRHLKHARPKPRPAPALKLAGSAEIIPDLTLEALREIGALIPRPFPMVAYVISGCLGINVVGDDEEAIYRLFDKGEAMIEATPDHLHAVSYTHLTLPTSDLV